MQVTEKEYKGTPCLLLSNAVVEMLVSTAFGPRVLVYGFAGGQNFFRVFDDQIRNANTNEWQIYGGHRLWLAPEAHPRSYYPDNGPIEYRQRNDTVAFIAPIETDTGCQKIIDITLQADSSTVILNHHIVNHNVWDIELSAWGLSVMNIGGRAIIPHEDFRPHPDYLAPARSLVLWHFTDMSDPRFTWGRKYIQMAQDSGRTEKIKIGVYNTKGREAYILHDEVFIKQHAFIGGATYPDMGCNAEFFTNSEFLEMESLSPLTMVPPGGEIQHTEVWSLEKMAPGLDEHALDEHALDEHALDEHALDAIFADL